MNISLATTSPKVLTSAKPAPARDEVQVDDIPVSASSVTAGALGAGAGLIDGFMKAPEVAWETFENAWQSEKLGPSLKPLMMVASPLVAAVNTVASPIWGAGKFAEEMASGDVTGSAMDRAAQATKNTVGSGEFSSADLTVEKLEALGEAKLAEGEMPVDLPFVKPLFGLMGGVASTMIGGSLGLVAGAKMGAVQGAELFADTLNNKYGLSFSQRLGALASIPLLGVQTSVDGLLGGMQVGIAESGSHPWSYSGLNPMELTYRYFTGPR